MSNLERIKSLIQLPVQGPSWLIDESPSENSFPCFDKAPLFKLTLTNHGWPDYEDPDIELALFEHLEDAYGCIADAIQSQDLIDDYTHTDTSVSYAIFQTSEGYLVAWDDESLEFGGNILAYGPEDQAVKVHEAKARSTYSECHFGSNASEIDSRQPNHPELALWKKVFHELGAAQ